MGESNFSNVLPGSKSCSKGAYSSISELMVELPDDIIYAIERGLPELDQSLVSDLDIVITKKGFIKFYKIVSRHNMIVSSTLSFGGVRLFVAFADDGIKRIDCMWSCGYLGVPICNVNQILNARYLDKEVGLFMLPELSQAEVAFAVKNAHGGAEKYRSLLERNGLEVLGKRARRYWLIKQSARHPLTTLFGIFRLEIAYASRVIFPSGIKVYGMTAEQLRESKLLCYLFQNRIREVGRVDGFIRSHFGSELCVVRSKKQADIDFLEIKDLQSVEQMVLGYLRQYRAHIPSSMLSIS